MAKKTAKKKIKMPKLPELSGSTKKTTSASAPQQSKVARAIKNKYLPRVIENCLPSDPDNYRGSRGIPSVYQNKNKKDFSTRLPKSRGLVEMTFILLLFFTFNYNNFLSEEQAVANSLNLKYFLNHIFKAFHHCPEFFIQSPQNGAFLKLNFLSQDRREKSHG